MSPTPPETPPPAKTNDKFVVYVGTADVREIDSASWKQAGVEDQKKIVWDSRNNHTVPASEFNDDALKYLDERDSGFVVKVAD